MNEPGAGKPILSKLLFSWVWFLAQERSLEKKAGLATIQSNLNQAAGFWY